MSCDRLRMMPSTSRKVARRVTESGADARPAWSPRGRLIAVSIRDGETNPSDCSHRNVSISANKAVRITYYWQGFAIVRPLRACYTCPVKM